MKEDIIYYRAYYEPRSERVKISKRKSKGKPWINEFLTEKEALNDIMPHLKLAKAQLKYCIEKYKYLSSIEGFTIDYYMEGDTHGIYEDYLYMTVTIKDYEFKQIID